MTRKLDDKLMFWHFSEYSSLIVPQQPSDCCTELWDISGHPALDTEAKKLTPAIEKIEVFKSNLFVLNLLILHHTILHSSFCMDWCFCQSNCLCLSV